MAARPVAGAQSALATGYAPHSARPAACTLQGAAVSADALAGRRFRVLLRSGGEGASDVDLLLGHAHGREFAPVVRLLAWSPRPRRGRGSPPSVAGAAPLRVTMYDGSRHYAARSRGSPDSVPRRRSANFGIGAARRHRRYVANRAWWLRAATRWITAAPSHSEASRG